MRLKETCISNDGASLIAAYQASDIIYEENSLPNVGLNLSQIATRLIQECGSKCERFASDFLVTWEAVLEDIEHLRKTREEDSILYIFGIRKDGVDGSCFTLCRLYKHDSLDLSVRDDYYRGIFGLCVECIPEDDIFSYVLRVTFKDIQANIK